MNKKLNLPLALGIFLIGILLSSVSEGLSQTTNYYTWNNSTDLWSTTSAWTPNGGPQNTSSTLNTNVAVFAATGAGNNAVLLDGNRTVYGLVFTNGANAYTFGSQTTSKQLDIMSNVGLQNVSGQNQIFNLAVANSGSTGNWTNGAGSTTTFNNGLNLTTNYSSGANNVLVLSGAGNWNVASAIANGGSATAGVVRVFATGTTTFSGNNTYDGNTWMNAAGGTLTLSGDNSGAAGGVTLSAGTLNINNNNALGTGALQISGTSTINNTSGSAVVNAGNQAWTWNTGLAFGSATNSAANNLSLGSGTVAASDSRTIALAGSGTKLTIGGVNINNTSTGRTITANGAGNTLEMGGLTLSANTGAAVTVILDGTANLGVTGAIVNGQSFANGVQIKGTGTKTFSGANTYTGTTDIQSGATLLYGANNVTADAGGQMYVSGSGGTLDIATYNDTVSSVRVNAGGTLSGTTGILSAGSFVFYGNSTASAILGGSAATLWRGTADTVTLLSGANTYGGLTTVSVGTLKLGSSTALGSTVGSTIVNTGGFLDLNGQTGVAEALNIGGTGGLLNTAVGTASVSGVVDIGSGMTVNTTGDITLSGQLRGGPTQNLTKSGAGTLKFTAANSTFSGTNTVSAGTLLVDTGANVAISTSIVNGGLLDVNGTAGSVTVNSGGSLGGSGTVGAVTLTTGSFLKPGNSPGLLTAASSSWAAGSTYQWQIDNAAGTLGINWDVFSVTGALDMSALSSSSKMNLVLESLSLANYSTTAPFSWVIAKAATFTGIADGTQNLTDLFNINSALFNGGAPANLPNDGFQVVASGVDSNNLRTLSLMAIPEPSTGALLGFGLGGLVMTRLLRRKQS